MHKSWNFFKHGDRDPQGVLDFDEVESQYLIFIATLECGELTTASIQMQVYHLWFIALGLIDFGGGNEIQKLAKALFPDLQTLSRVNQLTKGSEVLIIQENTLH